MSLDPSSSSFGSALCSCFHSATVPVPVPPAKNTACAPLSPIFSTSLLKLVVAFVSVMSRLSCPTTAMPRSLGVARDEFRERQLKRVLVVEHIQPLHAQRLHQLHLRFGLRRIARLQAPEGAFPGGVEAFGLVLAGVERGGQPHIRARRADLQDARGVDQRQRDRGRARVVVAQVGDRAWCPRRPSSRSSRSRPGFHSPVVVFESSIER